MSNPQQQFILGTAGHIDHGKTALVHGLTGIDTDRLPEEQRRGMTIDIGFARLDLGSFRLGIVDVPGHVRFIRNMLAGATGNDLAMLVIAADDSVMPQTREHLDILRLLELHHGVIAITKCDLVEPDLIELVEQETRELVAGTFLENAPMVCTSAKTGRGLDDLKAALLSVCRKIEFRPPGSLFRMAIDRSFVLRGQGTVVTGSVADGSLSVGDSVEWLPPQKVVRVRSLQSHGHGCDTIERGQRAAIGLAGVHHHQIFRGHELATPGYLRATRLITATVTVSPTSPWPIRHRATVRVHLGTAEVVARVALLSGNVLSIGHAAAVQLLLADPVAAVCGQPLVLRSLSPVVTVGGGTVLQPVGRRLSRRKHDAIVDLEALRSGDPTRRACAAVAAFGTTPWTVLDLCRDAALVPEEVDPMLERLEDEGHLVQMVDDQQHSLRLHAHVLREVAGRVEQALGRYHKEHPLQLSMPRSVLAHQVGNESLLAVVVKHMALTRRVTVVGDSVALAGHTSHLDGVQQGFYDAVIEACLTARFQPPAPAELASRHGLVDAKARQVLELAVARGRLVHLGGGLYLHSEHELALRQLVAQALSGTDGLTVSEVRQRLGTTRKFAVPFCEYLDRIGLTQRRGDRRVLTSGRAEKARAHDH